MSRNYELIRKAGDAIHAHREPGRYMPPVTPQCTRSRDGNRSEQPKDLDLNILDLLQAIFRRRNWIYALDS